MIKNFEEYINEDYFSKLANRKDNGVARIENIITEQDVLSILDDSYSRPKSITIRKNIVDIDGNVNLRQDIKEIPFQFGKVTGTFSCAFCKLESFKGCPEEVGEDFVCSWCNNIESFEGCPRRIGGIFACKECNGVTSFKGGPEFVGRSIVCDECSGLTSFEGCPEKVGRGLSAYSCKKLCSLEGLPKEINGNFDCRSCGKKFTEEEVRSLCNVKERILV